MIPFYGHTLDYNFYFLILNITIWFYNIPLPLCILALVLVLNNEYAPKNIVQLKCEKILKQLRQRYLILDSHVSENVYSTPALESLDLYFMDSNSRILFYPSAKNYNAIRCPTRLVQYVKVPRT